MRTDIIGDFVNTLGYKIDSIDVVKRSKPKHTYIPDNEYEEDNPYEGRRGYARRAWQKYASLCIVLTNGSESIEFKEDYTEKEKSDFISALRCLSKFISDKDCLT